MEGQYTSAVDTHVLQVHERHKVSGGVGLEVNKDYVIVSCSSEYAISSLSIIRKGSNEENMSLPSGTHRTPRFSAANVPLNICSIVTC